MCFEVVVPPFRGHNRRSDFFSPTDTNSGTPMVLFGWLAINIGLLVMSIASLSASHQSSHGQRQTTISLPPIGSEDRMTTEVKVDKHA